MHDPASGLATAKPVQPSKLWRRAAVVAVLSLLIGVGLPVGVPPNSQAGNGFGLSWLWSWMTASFAHAATSFVGQLPAQSRGSADGRGHYSNDTDVRRGAGSRQERVKGAVGAQETAPIGKPGIGGRPVQAPFNPATSVKQTGASTSHSDVYRNADGNYMQVAAPGAVNYQTKDGSWQPIDRTLTKGKDGRYRQKASSEELIFAAEATDPSIALVRVDASQSLGFGLSNPKSSTAVVNGNAALYPEVWPGVDLKLEMEGGATKESLILKSADAGSVFDFPLQLQGLTVSLDEKGSVLARDSAGKVQAVIPAGFMVDSRVDPKSGDFMRSNAVTYQLVTTGGGTTLRVSLDREWLRDPARVWPVTVDPTVFVARNVDYDQYVYSTDTALHHLENNFPIGSYDAGAHQARGLIQFSGLAGSFAGNTIAKVQLHTFLTYSTSCSPQPFEVWSAASMWAYTSTWPGPGKSVKMGGASPQPGAACTNSGANRSLGVWVDVDLDPTMVQRWVQGFDDTGMVIVAPNETDNTQWKRFTSMDHNGGALKSQLYLWYAPNVAPQVDSMYPVAGHQSPTLTPTLIAQAHDPDQTFAPFTYEFIVKSKNGDATNQIWTSGKTSASQVTVPANVLSWGNNYLWTVKVSDTMADSSTVDYPLSTPVPQPAVTSTLSQNGGKGFAAAAGNYTNAVTDVSVPTAGPPLAVQRSYNSLDGRKSLSLGTGWSSMLDMKIVENLNSPIAPPLVTITYPGGNELAFGRNANGTFTPPAGRYATLTTLTGGGYRLVDKEGNTYAFTRALGGTSGADARFGIERITDAFGRTLTFTYDAGNRITTATAASGRSLYLTWATPSGATSAHVSTVKTDQAIPGNESSRSVWTYNYTGDNLTSVCAPEATGCLTYTYDTVASSPYRAAVMNLGPSGYWRPGNGSTLVDEASAGNTIGGWDPVTGPLAASSARGAQLPGSIEAIALPRRLPSSNPQRAISVWFKMPNGSTAGGVVASQGKESANFFNETNLGYTPTLYVDATGYLHGQFPTVPTVPQGQANVPVGSLLGGGSGRCADIYNGSNANGTAINLWDCNGLANQKWTLTSTGQLQATLGGATKCLDVVNNGLDNGTRVHFWDCHAGLNQKWFMMSNGNIMSAASGRCLTAVNSGTVNGTPLEIWTCATPADPSQTWSGSAHNPIKSSAKVNDGQWHHAVLSAGWSSSAQALVQTMHVDGVAMTQTLIANPATDQSEQLIGVGFLSASWPNDTTADTTTNKGIFKFFPGSVAEVAYFDRPLTSQNVADLQAARSASVYPLVRINRPTGGVMAEVHYDPVSNLVDEVTDENNGEWRVAPGTLVGSHLVHSSTVAGNRAVDYWRMAEPTAVTNAVNEVAGGVATYHGVQLGVAGGPFAGTGTPSTFAGRFTPANSSHVSLPALEYPAAGGPNSISLWFRMSGSQGGVLYGWQDAPAGTTPTRWVPSLYVGTDGKLRGKWCWCGGSVPPMVSDKVVNNSQWHHVVLTTTTTTQKLYVDGELQGTYAAAPVDGGIFGYVNIGTGFGNSWPNLNAGYNYFQGDIGEVSFYRTELSAGQISAEYTTLERSRPMVSTPVLARRYVITDPSGGTMTTETYAAASGQRVAQTDALGKRTLYGYDEKGFLLVTVDPMGHPTTTYRDARGNVIQRFTCQDLSEQRCSSEYYEYFPDKTTAILTPRADLTFDPRNDKLVKAWGKGTMPTDPLKQDPSTDNRFLTVYTYDPATGAEIQVTDPIGRVAQIAYTDGTTVLAEGSTTAYALAGLPRLVTTADGSTKSIFYYANGDLAREVEPTGKSTVYSYDPLGRMREQKAITDTYPTGLITTLTYDKAFRVLTQQDPPVQNRVTGSEATHTARTTWRYNDDGLRTEQKVEDLTGGDTTRILTTEYNERGQQITAIDAKGKRTEFTYDAFGRVASRKDALGTIEVFEHDPAGQLLTAKISNYTGDPNNPQAPAPLTVESRAYDDAGLLASVTDANGTTTKYAYTDDGMPAKVTKVDANGRNPFVIEESFYNDSGFLVRQITNNGATERTFTLDNVGRATYVMLDPNGPLRRGSNPQYSADDQPVFVTEWVNGSNVVGESEAMYDAAGRQIAHTVYNGPSAWTPVGRWKLSETGGTVATDSSGNAHAPSANVSWSTDRPSSRPDLTGSTVFNGTSSKVNTDGPVFDPTRSFSMSAWAKIDTLGATNEYVAIRKSSGSGAPAVTIAYDGATQKWRGTLVNAPAGTQTWYHTYSAQPAQPGTWTHLTLAYSATAKTLKFYVNGVLAETKTDAKTFNDGKGFVSIGSLWGNDGFPGSIADVQIYQRALTDSQVVSIHGGTAPAATSSVIRTSTTYDQEGNITSSTDSRGNKTTYTLDEAGRQVITRTPQVTTESGGSPQLAYNFSYVGYDTFGEVTETKDALGNRVVTEYDANGRVSRVNLPSYTRPDTGAVLSPYATKNYDDLGRLISETDTAGRTTTHIYDQLGRAARTTAPAPGGGVAVTKTAYDLVGNPIQVTSPALGVSGATYDHLGRRRTASQIVSQDSATYTTNFAYGTATAADAGAGYDIGASKYGEGGWLLKATSPGNVVTKAAYNAAGETVSVTDGANNVTNYEWTAFGSPSRTVRADGSYQKFLYDLAHRRISIEDYNPASPTPTVPVSKVSNTLDPAGNILAATDALNHTTTFTYDATNLLTSQTEPVNATASITSSFGYDAAGNRTRFTDGRGHSFLTTYNSWGLPAATVEPVTTAHPDAADRTYTLAYESGGRVAKTFAPGGVTIANTYDTAGNLTQQDGAGAEAANASRTFGWDAAGRLTSFSAPGGSNTITYDDRNMPRNITGPTGNTSYTYWPDGQLKTRDDAAGQASLTYDTAGRLDTFNNAGAGVKLTYRYNSTNAVDRITYGNNENKRVFSYDLNHRLSGDILQNASGTTIASIGYVLDANGNLTSKTTGNFASASTNVYTHDWANRLIRWDTTPSGGATTTTTYEYDNSGNRTKINNRIFEYDERSRLKGSTSATYTYTARGTLRSTTEGSTTVNTKADAFGQIVEQGYGVGGGVQTYQYDAMGRAVKAGHQYSGVGNKLAADNTATYVRGINGEVVGTKAGAQPGVYAWTDLHTDIVAQFASSGASLAGSRAFEPMGKTIATSGSIAGSLGFQSEWTEPTTGRVNMAARWYNTDTGQFDSRDTKANNPSPESVNANRYAYGNANPLVKTDPTGHAVTVGEGGGGGAVLPNEYQVTWCESHPYHSSCKKIQTADETRPTKPGPCRDKCARPSITNLPYDGATIAAEIDRTKAAIEQANKAKNKSFMDILIDVGVGFLLDMLGITDIINCFTKGDLWACAQMIIGFLPWGKALKMAKTIVKAVDDAFTAYKAWRKLVKAAEEVIAVGRRALEVLEKAQTAIDVTNTVSIATGGGQLLPDLPTAGLPGPGKKKPPKGGGGKPSSGHDSGGSKAGNGDGGSPSHDTTSQPAARNAAADATPANRPIVQLDNNSRSNSPVGGGCKTHSFDPATPVLMADGTQRAIADVQVGDKVKATDPYTGATTDQPVTILHRNLDTELTDLTVTPVTSAAEPAEPARDGHDRSAGTVRGPTTTLHTTAHHPFWDGTLETWVDAAQLQPGHELVGPTGERQRIIAVRNFAGQQEMRDLTVDAIHTYYVVAGDTPVLVHNNNQGSQCGAMALLERAKDYYKEASLFASTVAVARVRHKDLKDEDGNPLEQIWVSTSQTTIPKGWNGMRRHNEVLIPQSKKGRGVTTHAEEDILDFLGDEWEIIEGASNVNICGYKCKPGLEEHGLHVGGPNERTRNPEYSPWRLFWRR